MRTSLLIGASIALSTYLAGCIAMPETIFRADPVSNNTVWYSGEEFQTGSKDSISVSVAFENELGRTMTFYMVVGNQGPDTVLVAPENIYFYGTYERGMVDRYDMVHGAYVFDTVRYTDTTYAINPERQLAGIDQQAAQANATYSTNNNLNAAAALLQLVGDVATIGKDKTEAQQKQEDQNRQSLENSEADNQITYSSTIDRLNKERDYWQNATLRKTTLFPNTAIGGKICFPVDPNLQAFKLIVPIDSTLIKFDFKQKPVGN